MASVRLPNKPLADIAGSPMIVQVWRRAMEAGIGPVVVAAAEPEIVAAVEAAGGRAVLTDPNHPSGSDRIFEALNRVDPDGRHDAIVNVQGDLPTLDPAVVRAALEPLADPAVDIATLITPTTTEEERVAAQFSRDFDAALRAGGHPVTLSIVPGANHGEVYSPAVAAAPVAQWLAGLPQD